MDYHCRDCGETGESELEVERVDGETVVYPLCAACGSDNLKPVDEIIDVAENMKGER
jgi:hypothetical protein